MKKELILAALTCTPIAMQAAERPNIVVFIADDHSVLDCEPYGAQTVQTPNIAHLATQGMTFNRAFVAAPYSGPSRASLFSGVMPPRHGGLANSIAPNIEMLTMVKEMQNQGYEVVSLGKTTHGSGLSSKIGFDFLIPERGPHPFDDTQLMGDLEEFLSQPKSDKPKCIFVGDRRPHSPWYHASIYAPANDASYPDYLIDDPESRELWGSYLTDVTNMDETMGKVEKRMREYFGGDDFIFMYTADHGANWPFHKGSLYDGGIQAPMIIRWPDNIERNVRTDAMVSWIDIIPTFVDIAGGGKIEDIDGKSFKNVLFDKSAKHRDYIFATHNNRTPGEYINRAVRSDKYKYIRNYTYENYFFIINSVMSSPRSSSYFNSWHAKYDKDPAAKAMLDRYHMRPYEEFYDIINDPTEQHNLALDPKYKGEMTKLSKMLDDFMVKQNDEIKMPEVCFPIKDGSVLDMVEKASKKFADMQAEKAAAAAKK